MTQGYLVIDSGGGSTRVALVSTGGEIREIKAIHNEFFDETGADGIRRVSFIPANWIARILDAARDICSNNRDFEVLAVSATSAREGVVLINEEGKAFIGLPNSDKRGKRIADELRQKTDIYSRTGKWCDELFSAFKIAGFAEENPDLFRNRNNRFTSISEWIGYEFTKEIIIERSHACETLIYDTSNDKWSDDLMKLFHIPGVILPDVAAAGTAQGVVRKDFSSYIGLPPQIPFIAAGADTQAAVKGSAAETDRMILVSGTTSPLVVKMDKPVLDPKGRFWLDCDLGQGWLAETNTGSSGININRYYASHPGLPGLDEIDREISRKKKLNCLACMGDKSFRTGRSVPKIGFADLEGERTHADAIGAIRMDIAYGIAENIHLLADLTGTGTMHVVGCGGGLRSDLQCQWISDASGKELIVPAGYDQASVQGCRVVCNNHFGIDAASRHDERRFYPEKDSMILQYREQWEALRLQSMGERYE